MSASSVFGFGGIKIEEQLFETAITSLRFTHTKTNLETNSYKNLQQSQGWRAIITAEIVNVNNPTAMLELLTVLSANSSNIKVYPLWEQANIANGIDYNVWYLCNLTSDIETVNIVDNIEAGQVLTLTFEAVELRLLPVYTTSPTEELEVQKASVKETLELKFDGLDINVRVKSKNI